jgi:hypothetical protein
MDKQGVFDVKVRQQIYYQIIDKKLDITHQELLEFKIMFEKDSDGNLAYHIPDSVYKQLDDALKNEIKELWQEIQNRPQDLSGS